MSNTKYITIETSKLEEAIQYALDTHDEKYTGKLNGHIKRALIENAVNPFDGEKFDHIKADEMLLWETAEKLSKENDAKIERISNMPDITNEEIEKAIAEYRKQTPQIYHGHIGVDVLNKQQPRPEYYPKYGQLPDDTLKKVDVRRMFLVRYFINKYKINADWDHCEKNIEIESQWESEYPTLAYLTEEDIENYNKTKKSFE